MITFEYVQKGIEDIGVRNLYQRYFENKNKLSLAMFGCFSVGIAIRKKKKYESNRNTPFAHRDYDELWK